MNKLQLLWESVGKMANVIDWRPSTSGPLDEEGILEDVYEKVDLAYTCVSYTARAIAQVPFRLMQYSRTGGDPVPDSDPLQQLVDRPNYMTNKFLFLEGIIGFLMIDGNVCIIPFPSPTVAHQLWIVRWENMHPVRSRTGHLDYWQYRPSVGMKPIELGPDEVIHLRFWNPKDPIEGMAPVKAGKLPILDLYKSCRYNQAFFDAGAVPGGLISTDQKLQPDTIKVTREQWKEKYGGYRKAHEVAVLQQGMKYQALSPSHKDMDFVQLQKMDKESIMQIWGMKKVILSVTEDMNYAIAREQRKEWWMGTCLPLMRMIADALSFGLLRNAGDTGKRFEFDITTIEALHDETDTAVKTMERLFRMGFTRNELNRRFHLGFDEQPWGDVAYVPVNMLAVNLSKKKQEEQEANREKALSDGFDRFSFLIQPDVNRLGEKFRRCLFKMRSKCLEVLREGDPRSLQNVGFEADIENMVREVHLATENMITEGVQFLSGEVEIEVDTGLGIVVSDSHRDQIFSVAHSSIVNEIAEIHREVLRIAVTEQDKEEVDRKIRQLFNTADKGVKRTIKALSRRVFTAISTECLMAIGDEQKETPHELHS